MREKCVEECNMCYEDLKIWREEESVALDSGLYDMWWHNIISRYCSVEREPCVVF